MTSPPLMPKILRVPIVSPNGYLPRSVHLYDESLPTRLSADNVATKSDLAGLGGVSPELVAQMIAQARQDVLAEVAALFENAGVKGYVFKADYPVASAILQHDFNRDGPVAVTVFSPEYDTQYEFFETHILDNDRVQIAFDEPIAFNAVVL